MSNAKKKYLAVWTLLLATFIIVTFVVPSEFKGFDKYEGAFWAGFLFVIVGMLINLACALKVLNDGRKRLFYNLPLIKLSYGLMIIMFVFGIAGMAAPNLPYWAGYVGCLVVLVFQVISIIKAVSVSEIIENRDIEVSNKTDSWKTIKQKFLNVESTLKNTDLEKLARKVGEKIKYADPVSNDVVLKDEMIIDSLIDECIEMIDLNNVSECSDLLEKLSSAIDNRNNHIISAK